MGSAADATRETGHRLYRRPAGEAFRVVPQLGRDGEKVLLLVAPTGVALYTFADIRDATAEALGPDERGSQEAPPPLRARWTPRPSPEASSDERAAV
jgi:hypothetical protein